MGGSPANGGALRSGRRGRWFESSHPDIAHHIFNNDGLFICLSLSNGGNYVREVRAAGSNPVIPKELCTGRAFIFIVSCVMVSFFESTLFC